MQVNLVDAIFASAIHFALTLISLLFISIFFTPELQNLVWLALSFSAFWLTLGLFVIYQQQDANEK